ncbi:MAG: hypothetical protein ABI416_11515 [Ginsengibacter sp.]
MKAIEKINRMTILVTLATTLIFSPSCKKEEKTKEPTPSGELAGLSDANRKIFTQFVFSPWHTRSSGVSITQRGIIEMSEPDQFTCYGLLFDGDYNPGHDITVTHDGGATWHEQSIAGLENKYLFGVAATTPRIAHLIGYDPNGGGIVSRTTDGGMHWDPEAVNAYTDPVSFPDDIQFFNPANGVIFGDSRDGYYEIYTTHNGGNTWNRVPSDRIPAPLPHEAGIPYLSDTYLNTIWVLVTVFDDNFFPISARILESDDRGESWYVKGSFPKFTGDGSLKFRNHSVGLFKNNGILYRTTDGGANWKVVNYSGTWFSFDLDNIPGLPGWWISTGGGAGNTSNSLFGRGSSISYDDGNHWIKLDTLNHTCVDMTSPVHGYSGGISTESGSDGVFVYSFRRQN